MNADEAVWSSLVRWVAAKTGVTVIRAYEEGPRPALPYVTVNLISSGSIRQHPWEIVLTSTGAETATAEPYHEWEWMFSLNAYGGDPGAPLRTVRLAMGVAQAVEPLLSGLTPVEPSVIRVLRERIDDKWEARAQMDIMLRGNAAESFAIDLIETATFDIQRTPDQE